MHILIVTSIVLCYTIIVYYALMSSFGNERFIALKNNEDV